MKSLNWNLSPHLIRVQVGGYQVCKRPMVLQTLLGSCVSACLYDPLRHIIGMNHFLLAGPHQWGKRASLESDSGYYGVHAMELLIKSMLKSGADKGQIKAKMFGGGDVLNNGSFESSNEMTVGKDNIRFLTHFLEQENIPLVAQDVGGNHGRVILFNSTDFGVRVKMINPQQLPKSNRGHDYWLKTEALNKTNYV